MNENKKNIDNIDDLIYNIDIVKYISQYVELEYKRGEYWGLCPFHDEKTPSFSVNGKKNRYYCAGCHASGNIVNFMRDYHKMYYADAIKHLSSYSGINFEQKIQSQTINVLKRFVPKKKKEPILNFLPENIIDQYKEVPVQSWIDENISYETQKIFNVRIDEKGDRIIFPIHDKDGNIISIKGRTLHENYKELGIPKYIYYTKVGTNSFLFGYFLNKDFIRKAKEVIVFESEKSVMKAYEYGIRNCVALSTSNMTDIQIKLLLSLQCNIVFAFDKDVNINGFKEKGKNKLKKEFQTLTMFTDVFIILDCDNLIDAKDSPIDRGLEVWNKLYKNKKNIKVV